MSITVMLLFIVCMINGQQNDFRFGNTQGDYMVLQQAPYRAQIWGFSLSNDMVTISLSYSLNTSLIETFISKTNPSNNIWKTYFSPRNAQNDIEYTVTATSQTLSKTISLSHILFGDVFICSGQSNMFFSVDNAFNATEEVEAANNYSNIRVYTVAQNQSNESDEPLLEIINNTQPWSVSNSSSIGGGNWTYFSAVCWFYGRDLYQYLNYPLGLIATSYGGTAIRAWMSPEAREICNESTTNCPKPIVPDSSLWNGMIYPFLQTTIKGAIWYQGESDVPHTICAEQYHCAMPTMINSWRKYWHSMSDTDALFPFGYVQLAAWNDLTYNETCSSPTQNDTADCYNVGTVRWGQSANYGYVPNKLMVNTFMAGAIDLGDPYSPWHDVHPRYKQTVGKRLSDAAKNIIYGESDIYFQGPIVEKFTVDKNNKMAIIRFRNVGEFGLEIRNYAGFEFYSNGTWITMINTTFSTNGNFEIMIALMDNLEDSVERVRFNWYYAPCFPDLGPFNCPVYDKQYQLPVLPFITNLTSN